MGGPPFGWGLVWYAIREALDVSEFGVAIGGDGDYERARLLNSELRRRGGGVSPFRLQVAQVRGMLRRGASIAMARRRAAE